MRLTDLTVPATSPPYTPERKHDAIADVERMREQQRDTREHVAQYLLESDAEHDARDRATEEKILDRHLEQVERDDEHEDVARGADGDLDGGGGGAAGTRLHDSTGLGRESVHRGDTDEDEENGRTDADSLLCIVVGVQIAVAGAGRYGPDRDEAIDHDSLEAQSPEGHVGGQAKQNSVGGGFWRAMRC